jgi:hypothetical protein
MHDWPFDQEPNCAAITLKRIVAGEAPILYVSHDADDHGWQFMDGSNNLNEDDAAVVAMAEIVEQDASILEVADLAPGWCAWRSRVGEAWQRGRKSD